MGTQSLGHYSHSIPEPAEMTFILSLKLAMLAYPLASALVLNLTSSINSQQAQNTTTASSVVEDLQLGEKAANSAFDAYCNGEASGVGLSWKNCYDTVSQGIPDVTGKDVINYGDRSVGNFDVNLPQRYINGRKTYIHTQGVYGSLKSIGDGQCIVDLTLEDISKTTPYYPFGVALAATFLAQKYVTGQSPAQGGTVKGYGLEGSGKFAYSDLALGLLMVIQTRTRT